MRQLPAAAEQWAAGRGLTEMSLSAASDCESALAAWRALGFVEAEQLQVRTIGTDGNG